jgi:hypothetical protein
MTTQVGENLIYKEKRYSFYPMPLGEYFQLSGVEPEFEENTTALWRGYIGTWEIIENRFYLIEIDGDLKDGTKVALEAYFPGYPKRVFAHWYSGVLRATYGKIVKFGDGVFVENTYEVNLLIDIDKGVITEIKNEGIDE